MKRTFSSQSASPFRPHHRDPFKSLGVVDVFVHGEVIGNLQHLPEIKEVLEGDKTENETLQLLERATEIFRGFGAGGQEHLASLALLAEASNSLKNLQELEDLCVNQFQREAVQIARAKKAWLDGDTSESRRICDELLEGDCHPGIALSAWTGLGCSRVLAVKDIDDVFSVRDPFRKTTLDVNTRVGQAAAQLNMGVSEIVYAKVVTETHGVEAPLDPALRAWNQGVSSLSRTKADTGLIEALLKCNMAWALLEIDDDEEASRLGREALKAIDSTKGPVLGRTLTVVGTTSHKNGDAVTAQGLFSSALDELRNSPLERRETLLRYADLCREWDKREKEAEKYVEMANKIDLPGDWKDKPVYYGSMWFWTPSLLLT